MRGENYILPGEFAMLVAFWFAIPLLIAFLTLTWFFVKHRLFRHHFSRLTIAFLLITVLSIVLGIFGLVWSPTYILRFLGVKDVFIGGKSWSVLPFAFVSVTFVAPIVGWWALRYKASLSLA
jgi:hypothetical protein